MFNMKLLFTSLLAFIILACATSCQKQEKAIIDQYKEIVADTGPLEDDLLKRYCAAVADLQKAGPGLLQNFRQNGQTVDAGQAGYSEIDNLVKKHGFSGYAEFVKVNAKVAWAWNLTMGEAGIEEFTQKHNDGVAQLQAALKDPQVPEEAKVELRKALETLESQWDNDQKWANLVVDRLKPLSNPEDMAAVKKHKDCLMAAFTAGVVPRIPVEE